MWHAQKDTKKNNFRSFFFKKKSKNFKESEIKHQQVMLKKETETFKSWKEKQSL